MKVLIANRGEIAVRVIRACRELGLPTVAVYSDCDRGARHVRDADQAVHIGPSPAVDSYLRIDRLIDAARATGADAVHPGYGFLAENAAFAQACRDAGLTFIGPSPDAIRLMGSKTGARDVAIAAGVPVVPGSEAPLDGTAGDEDVQRQGDRVGYPLMVKAVAGGGGKGMRVVESRDALLNAVRTARSEAGSSFGDTSVYFERRVTKPRHVEIQLLGDQHGTIVPFVERECSIQRRHQKVVEESPSTVVDPRLRRRMADAAAAVAARAGYSNAGTIEFLLDEDGSFYFLEMNTRLQVEHPVTEMVTSLDLVQWQIRVARGERLTIDPDRALTPLGHAIECRIYAEDPGANFMPSPGRISRLRIPQGPGVRDDGGVYQGSEVSIYYDPMISKFAVHGRTRAEAIDRMRRALAEYEIEGVKTTLPFFRDVMRDEEFIAGRLDTGFISRFFERREAQASDATIQSPVAQDIAIIAAALLYASRSEAKPATSVTRKLSPWVMSARENGS